jgi:hypothetical protein
MLNDANNFYAIDTSPSAQVCPQSFRSIHTGLCRIDNDIYGIVCWYYKRNCCTIKHSARIITKKGFAKNRKFCVCINDLLCFKQYVIIIISCYSFDSVTALKSYYINPLMRTVPYMGQIV